MVKHDADGVKTPEGLHHFKTGEVVVELIFLSELIGCAPEEKYDEKISNNFIKDCTDICAVDQFRHKTPHIAIIAILFSHKGEMFATYIFMIIKISLILHAIIYQSCL